MISLKKNKLDFISLSILSIPILSILSILFLELVLIFIFICFVFNVLKKKEAIYFQNFFFKFFIFFYFFLLINYLIQSEEINTLSIIFYFRYIFYTISIYYFLNKKKNLFNYFLNVVAILVFLVFFDSLFQYYFGYNIIGLDIIEIHRVSSFFGDELILGSYIFRLLPFLIIFNLLNKNNLFGNILIFFSLIIIFLSGERTSMILSFFYIFLYFVIVADKNIKKRFIIFFLIFFILISSIFIFSKNYSYRYIFQPIKDMNSSYQVNKDVLESYNKETKILFFSGLHHNFMITSLRIFNDNKFFGSGPRSYRDICHKYKINKYSCDTHPHNFYLQLLSETGLFGLSFLIFIYLLIINKILKLIKSRDKNFEFKIIILLYYCVVLWPIIPSGNFFNNWLSIMIYLPFAFYLYFDKVLNK